MLKKIFILSLLAGSLYAQPIPKSVSDLLPSVQPDSIKKHIVYLADDRLLGRLPGTPGYQIAVDYVVDHMKQLGLKPAGENNSYLQEVKIKKAKLVASGSSMMLTSVKQPLTMGVNYVLHPHFEKPHEMVNASLAFAGYGIQAPSFGYDDYKSLDVKGKVVIVMRGSPDSFSSTLRAHFMNIGTIVSTAVQQGAVGVLIIAPENISMRSGLNAMTKSGINIPVNTKGELFDYSSRGAGGMGIKLFGQITPTVFMELAKLPEQEFYSLTNKIKAGTPASLALDEEVAATTISEYETITSYNVIGLLPGSDATLKNQYVIHSSHLDHIGITAPIKGDSINNGAHDNASGISCTLEVARLYTKLKIKPKRSLLFVMVTAEEMGLLGSTYFAEYPTVNKSNIVADINMDMPTIIAPFLSAVPLGADHSSLMKPVKAAAAYLKIDVENDPEPEENRFVRSDQYSFVRKGIPALHVKYGDKTANPGEKLSDLVKKWRAETYHKPQDQIDGGLFDFEAGKNYVQLNFLISYQIAQETNKPTWNTDSFFGKMFSKR